ncbi:Transposon Ty3-I Gag-Pol polyprotein [Vitis vinifera]|uniref:Transposon Ty3-I Gag-Pol polyprotein n=1 Tax=Vitis vinifera TaxID=29760 RepID=A0A438GJE7_VITVI|nr:Transposon Ty3-I Gag-Pol polyprotein [Vitis vinifera]
MVVVPKKEGKWRMCVDYTNLNNACPKDSFPLPRIDQIVDSTAGQRMISFLDAFSGYHQIPMASANEEKTVFITPHGLYCYKVMSFGLKNAGATYQRLMTKIFKPLVCRTVEIYIDDIVVKSKIREEHTLHLQEVFHLLRNYGMKLNPSKCVFGVSAGKFLGFMVSQRGIEVSPNQVKAVMATPPPRNKKELQRLTGKLVALGRFIARFTDELRPFFPRNTKKWAISAVLFRCPSRKEQKPIYYVSRALADVETKYSKMELTALAFQSVSQKLRPYFQAHPVVVLTDQPLRNILHKLDLTEKRLQWAIELSEYGIEFQPRLSMKGQVMADFVLEYSRRPTQHKEPHEEGWWTLRVDGASQTLGSRVGLLLQSSTGEQLEQAIRLGFPASNNEAEYEAILFGLDLALALSVSRLRVYSDSQLVVRHVQKEYEAKYERMARYLTKPLPSPIKEAILLPIHVQTNSSVAEASTCNTIEANQAYGQEWTEDIMRTPTAVVAQKKFLFVATDYFNKWVETEAYASIKDKDLTNITFWNFCSELNIRNLYSTPRYPQSNGQAEATNNILITALKKRLEQAKGKWVEELPGVLWAYRTTPGRPTGNTPFALAYGMDAVIPTEIGLPTIQTEAGPQDDANAELRRNLD